jgi:hypothetical protein
LQEWANTVVKSNAKWTALKLRLRPWFRVFKDENIHYVDGENMLHNADVEMSTVLNFIEAPVHTYSFEQQKNKGFSCLRQPLPFCLNPAKGTSRKRDVYKDYPAITKKLIRVMKKPLEENVEYFGFKTVEQKFQICEGTASRFQWTKRFICPLRRIKYESDYPTTSSSSSSSSNVLDPMSHDPMTENGFVNLDAPFGESKNQIDLEQLGEPQVDSINEPTDPFKKKEFYQLANQGLGPWSFRDDWDPEIGYKLYETWVDDMKEAIRERTLTHYTVGTFLAVLSLVIGFVIGKKLRILSKCAASIRNSRTFRNPEYQRLADYKF